MKLYKISLSVNTGYDTYDSAVVCAESPDDARTIHPSEFVKFMKDGKWYGIYSGGDQKGQPYETENIHGSWVSATSVDKVVVEEIGEAKEGLMRGVICASFINAG